MRPYFLVLLSLLASRTQAQRLLWETTYSATTTSSSAFLCLALTPTNQLLVTGGGGNAGPGRAPFRAVFRSYSLNGTLLHSQLGRGLITGEQALCAGPDRRYWWIGNAGQFGVSNTPSYMFAHRLTTRGDTLAGGPVPAPSPPAHYGFAVLASGRQIIVAGTQDGTSNGQRGRYTLTAFDTATWAVRWRYVYSRPVYANDFAIGITRTPRGGYLITGDGQPLNASFQHLLLETDSLGRQLKQRLIYPLGPTFVGGSAARKQSDVFTNIITLPNAQGYLTTGVADSASSGNGHNMRAYLMRLDTALNVTWVYRNPPDLFGTGNASQRVNKVRLLGDGTAAYLVRDLRGVGTPDLYVVRVDLATGRRRSVTLLQSNTQAAVIPFDWDLVGDGTLVVCGKSQQVGTAVLLGWLARFDVRGTPLATARLLAAAPAGRLTVWPNPARQQVRVSWPAGLAAAGSRLELRDALGRLLQTQALAAGQQQAELTLTGVPAGVYVLRLLGPQGTLSQRLAVE